MSAFVLSMPAWLQLPVVPQLVLLAMICLFFINKTPPIEKGTNLLPGYGLVLAGVFIAWGIHGFEVSAYRPVYMILLAGVLFWLMAPRLLYPVEGSVAKNIFLISATIIIFHALTFLAGWFTAESEFWQNGYFVGIFDNKNNTATALGLTLIVFAWSAFELFGSDRRAMLASLILLILGAILLVYTGSRGGLMAFLIGFVVLGIAKFGLTKKGVLPLSVAAAIFFYFLVFSDREFFLDDARYTLWSVTLDKISEQPWFGYGPNSFGSSIKEQVTGIGFPHNIYLEALYSLGIVGSALMVAGIVMILRHVRFSTFIQDPASRLALAVGMNILIHGMVDFQLFRTIVVGNLTFVIAVFATASCRDNLLNRDCIYTECPIRR